MANEPANASLSTNRDSNNLPATGYMLIAVFGISLIPLFVDLGGGSKNPFIFNAWLRIGASIGCLLFLLVQYRGARLERKFSTTVMKWVFTWPNNKTLILTTLVTFEYALFAWSVKFIDITVAAILFETWPVFVILFSTWLFKEDLRYRRITPMTIILVFLSVAGFVFAIASQTVEVSVFQDIVNLNSLIGAVLVSLAAITVAFVAYGFKWGADLSQDLAKGEDAKSLEVFCATIALLITSLVSVVVSTGIGLFSGETLTFQDMEIPVVAGIVAAFSWIALRKANFTTDNLGINAIAFITPILSVTWLFWIADAKPIRLDYLVIGAAAIITANLLINFEAEIRWGFKALILALGTCGAVVYLRDGVFELLGVVKWNWTGSGYFESITLAATVFILLLAFRVARLVSRTSEEDNRTFIVYRKLDLLARRGIINPEVCYYILQIDQANNNVSAEQAAYAKARRLIAAVDPRHLNEADSQLLSDAEANLDALARSKQVDIHLGEQFALGIFGAITIGLALLTLPPQVEEGWTRLMVDLFAMLISAVIIFLLVHIQDLQRERDGSKLESLDSHAAYRNYLARFLDTRQRVFDQWLSFTVGTAIVLAYAGLLAHRWLGWLG